MSKKCKACNKEMSGWGDTCSECRKAKSGDGGGYSGGGGAASDKCQACGKVAYAMERIQVEGLTFHPTCFKCTHCGNKLSLGNFSKANDGRFYCKTHYMELFKRKGRYSIDKLPEGIGGFDETVYKAAWDGAGGDAKKVTAVMHLVSEPKDYADYLSMCKAGKFKEEAKEDVNAAEAEAAKAKAQAEAAAAQEEEQARRVADIEKAEKEAEDERTKAQEEATKAMEEEQVRRVSESSASPERKRSSFVPDVAELAAQQAKKASDAEAVEKAAQEEEANRKKAQEEAEKAMEEEQARRVSEAGSERKRSSFTPNMAELAAKVAEKQEDAEDA